MIANTHRIGNFTSSEIYRLMGSPAPAKTYIEEKNLERKLGRSISVEAYSRDMAWGKLLEKRVFDLIEFGYELHSDKTDVHPDIPYWAGSKDLIIPGYKIGDIKCFQPKNFARYSDVLMQQDVSILREEFPKEYWQLVSNAIINGVDVAEAIAYMPYYSELPEVRELADCYDGPDQWKYRFIAESPDEDLSFIPDGGYYKNLICFEFTISLLDKVALEGKVRAAGLKLISLVTN